MRALTVLLLALHLAAARAEPPPDPEQLYREAVYILGGHASVVSKWDDTLRFAVLNAGGPADAPALARAIFTEAATLSGLTPAVAPDPLTLADYLALLGDRRRELLRGDCAPGSAGCVNFVVTIADAAAMLALVDAVPLRPVYRQALLDAPDLPCFFAPLHRGRQRIHMAFVYVNRALAPAMLRTCLQEEIYQSFGLFNDAGGSRLFSFNNVVAPKTLTRYDRALLQALYDPRIKAGYPVEAVARLFLKKLGY